MLRYQARTRLTSRLLLSFGVVFLLVFNLTSLLDSDDSLARKIEVQQTTILPLQVNLDDHEAELQIEKPQNQLVDKLENEALQPSEEGDQFDEEDPETHKSILYDNDEIVTSQQKNQQDKEEEYSEFDKQFYGARFLPKPQLDFFPRFGRQLRYQMHNCLRGRDGSKAGLLDAGIPRVFSQRNLENMPLHLIDAGASIMVACNAKLPMYRLSRDPRVAGKRLVSSAQGLLSKLCLGSMKTKQLECRRALSEKWGCKYESLGIQPAQFVLSNPEECAELMIQGKIRDRSWLSKPSGGIRGRGIRYFPDTDKLIKDIENRGGCLNSNATGIRGRLVQEYVSQPALIDGKFKFDIRTWLLVASVDPLIIFYHEGFVRVAKQVYNEKSRNKLVHITNARGQNVDSTNVNTEEDEENGKYMRSFAHVSNQLNKTHGLPTDFMNTEYLKQIMRAQAFAALSQFSLESPTDIFTKKGFYQIYACDSMVDRFGKAHLLECNGFPAEIQQQTVTGKVIWGEMIALLLNLHLEPWRLMKDQTPPPKYGKFRYIRDGVWKTGTKIENGESFKAYNYSFGGWHLVFNELETPIKSFNVCTI